MAKFGRRGCSDQGESRRRPEADRAGRGGRSWGRRPPRDPLVALAGLWGGSEVCWIERRAGVLFIGDFGREPENGITPAIDYGEAGANPAI